MAEIISFNVKKDKIMVNAKISPEEYELVKNETKNLVILPINVKMLNQPLTTGKLGNSNRIMIPKKFLKKT